jgi:hypothetical protein
VNKGELRNLQSSPSIIRVIKSRRMRWAGHIARLGQIKNSLQFHHLFISIIIKHSIIRRYITYTVEEESLN